MKKILSIFLTVIILFGSLFGQVNKAHANPLAGALTLGAGAGYSASAVYVLTGLLVASGAGVLGLDYADEIESHARSVWNQTNDVAKEAFVASVDASIAAGKGSVALGQDVLNGFKEAGLGSWSWLKNKFAQHEISTTYGTRFDAYFIPSTTEPAFDLSLGANVASNYSFIVNGRTVDYFMIWGGSSGKFHIGMGSKYATVTGLTNIVRDSSIHPSGNLGNYITSFDTAVEFLAHYGISLSLVSNTIENPTNLVLDDALNANLDVLANGTKEVNLSLDNWLAKTPTGEALQYNETTGTMQLDGVDYTGSFEWDTPKLGVANPANLTYSNPTTTLDNVVTGDSTFITDKTTTGEGTGEGTGTGSTDWTSSPTKKIDWSKLAVAAGTFTTVFPFSIPWDVFRLISVLDVEPIAPKFVIDTNENVEIGGKGLNVAYDFDIDFSTFDPIAAIVRWALILIFDIAIILALRRLTPD